jgi:glutaredoxin
MNAVDKATRVADEVGRRVDPLLERSGLADRVRRRHDDAEDDLSPRAEAAPRSPSPSFGGSASAPAKPPVLGNPDVPAQVYGYGTDPWTGRTLQLLEDRDVAHDFVDLEDDVSSHFEPHLVRETGTERPPFVYLRGVYLGGYNALDELDRLGQLERRTAAPDEQPPERGVRIVVPKQGGDHTPEGERS